MLLSQIKNHAPCQNIIDRYYVHNLVTDAYGKRAHVGLDTTKPKVFDFGTANPNDELGYARFCEQYRNSESTDTSGYINADVLDVAQRALDLQIQTND